MAEPARVVPIDRVRAVLARLLSPRLVREAMDELAVEETPKPAASPEALERARTWARREARR